MLGQLNELSNAVRSPLGAAIKIQQQTLFAIQALNRDNGVADINNTKLGKRGAYGKIIGP
jgi:hypothetical protein